MFYCHDQQRIAHHAQQSLMQFSWEVPDMSACHTDAAQCLNQAAQTSACVPTVTACCGELSAALTTI